MVVNEVTSGGVRLDLVHRNGSTYLRRARSTAVERDEHNLARYVTWGCRCLKCRRARRSYDRERRAAIALLRTGVVRRRIPARPAAAALEQLRTRGWSMREIAEMVECSDSTLHRLARSARSGRGRVWSDIGERLTALADG